jgi:c-di-GMP phosphodiesterase
VGLFSTLDALVDRDLREVVQSLPLHVEIRNALLDHSGRLGEQLDLVLAFERGELEGLPLQHAGLVEMQRAFLRAASWVKGVEEELAAVS